jgi:hypothetical protein
MCKDFYGENEIYGMGWSFSWIVPSRHFYILSHSVLSTELDRKLHEVYIYFFHLELAYIFPIALFYESQIFLAENWFSFVKEQKEYWNTTENCKNLKLRKLMTNFAIPQNKKMIAFATRRVSLLYIFTVLYGFLRCTATIDVFKRVIFRIRRGLWISIPRDRSIHCILSSKLISISNCVHGPYNLIDF